MMTKANIRNNIIHGVPVYVELSRDLICINDILNISMHDCCIDDKPTLLYNVYFKHTDVNPITITPEDYKTLKTYLTII